jgi:hypothetical protein
MIRDVHLSNNPDEIAWWLTLDGQYSTLSLRSTILRPVDLTSIDTNEYLVGLNGGPRGDDGKDLGTANLFGVVDGDDGVGMSTLSSNESTTTVTSMPPQGPG